MSKCSFGACSAILIPRKHPVKSAETLPKGGQPACLFLSRSIPHLLFTLVGKVAGMELKPPSNGTMACTAARGREEKSSQGLGPAAQLLGRAELEKSCLHFFSQEVAQSLLQWMTELSSISLYLLHPDMPLKAHPLAFCRGAESYWHI